MKRIVSLVRRCADDYGMIAPGDRIAVGLSGGKDSLLTLAALCKLRAFSPVPFTLRAITLDMGFPGMDFGAVRDFCAALDVPYHLQSTQIAEIVFDVRKEAHPCSLCAKMRRGALHDAALRLGCAKVALGHHFDDAVETFWMSLRYESRLHCFQPVTYLDRRGVTLIRPLLYVREAEVRRVAAGLPVVHNPCPANGHTKRQEAKEFLASHPGFDENLFRAMQSLPLKGWGRQLTIVN
jgi:tRNA(Ile)-lysidine synthase TilS/MesJ